MKKSLCWILSVLFIAGIAFADPLTRLYISFRHQVQAANLCVPTSASMVIEYYGDKESPDHLKALAQGDIMFQGTHYNDIARGLRTLGYFWQIRSLDVDTLEFQASLLLIEAELTRHHPPLVDISVHNDVGPNLHGHTMPIVGFDNESKEIIFNDPAKKNDYVRRMSFSAFQKCWHSAQNLKYRVIMLTRPKGDSSFVNSK